MDAARQHAIAACGRCGQPEDAHRHRTAPGEDEELAAVLFALAACPVYVASDAAVIYQKHLAITDNRAPVRRPGGPIGKRAPLCTRCGHRGHPKETCPF